MSKELSGGGSVAEVGPDDVRPDARAEAAEEFKTQILERADREGIKFMRLQFSDILGTIKNVEVPRRQFEDALDGRIMFDGSSIEGFVRIEESDMFLKPDLATFRVFPWAYNSGDKVARWSSACRSSGTRCPTRSCRVRHWRARCSRRRAR